MEDESQDSQAEQIRGSRGKRESGGASIRMEDGRVSKAVGWLWTAIGAGIIGATLLAANNLYQLNLAVNRMADNNAIVSQQLADHELRMRALERSVTTLEGKNLRGGPDLGGVRRGN